MADGQWWRSAVIQQVYIRSYADGNGDGLGDIAGLRARLPYIAALGVDAIWINPWYPSPQADAGYDVITYHDVEPRFGTMDEAEALVAEAHALGVRVLLDIVPNHCSHLHPWFQAALAAGPGSPERERFVFRDGGGADGDLPPNDWPGCFGGRAWTRITEADGRPGQWYLHLFAPEQPDRNWLHPDTAAEYEDALRFWFDRGVDGFRIDVAHSLFKLDGLPDVGDIRYDEHDPRQHPFWDPDPVHEVYRSWRRIADSYDPPRVFVAEAWVPKPARLARYVRPDELHTTFNFDYLRSPWDAAHLRRVIDATMREHALVDAPPTWVLSNHDVARHVSRFARFEQAPSRYHLGQLAREHDLAMGTRRARASVLLMAALPGSCYVYQGEELGLPEVEDLPPEVLQDPTWERSGHTDPGRDGCRVPIPWSGDRAPFGFSPDGATVAPWLPQPEWFAAYTAESQEHDPSSMLALYRTVLHTRRAEPALRDGAFEWLDLGGDVLAFRRGDDLLCVVNFGTGPVELPEHRDVVVASADLSAGSLPADAAAWLRI
ncbi:MAG: glycoside hydrolase family 13 protein [Ilumatobacteraceae bacterium]